LRRLEPDAGRHIGSRMKLLITWIASSALRSTRSAARRRFHGAPGLCLLDWPSLVFLAACLPRGLPSRVQPGFEALETLSTRMEDERDRFAVIVQAITS
jgi:hypothetical protein